MSDWLNSWLSKNLNNEQLEELRSSVYDRWTWDSGSADDRALFDALQAEADQRKIAPTIHTLTFTGGVGVVLTDSPGDGTITISLDEDYLAEKIRNDMDARILESVLEGIKQDA